MGEARKSIFITGAGSGIGRATAHLFAARGWFVGLSDVNDAGLEETARGMPAESSLSIRLDVRDRSAWADAVARFGAATGGRCDVLFNNAGVGRGGAFEEMAPEDCELIVDVNLKGAINGLRAALPLLRATQGACAVNVASAAGFHGAPQMAVYSATKAAVLSLTESLSVEFARYGVRVASLAPWFVETPILDNAVSRSSNLSLRELLINDNVPIYPVARVAERAWDIANAAPNSTKLHYCVGDAASFAQIAARLFPGVLRARLRKLARVINETPA